MQENIKYIIKTELTWPENCSWPEPLKMLRNGKNLQGGLSWDDVSLDDLVGGLDKEAEELVEIKEYFDGLVTEGRLNEDYCLNEDFLTDVEELECKEDETESFKPEKGTDYWLNNRFDVDSWEEDFSEYMNMLKLAFPNPVIEIQSILGYDFINENLLRQAFTRRAFALEYNCGNSEKLEFLGDTVLNTVVTREIARQLTEIKTEKPEEPFQAIALNLTCREELSQIPNNIGKQKTTLDEGDFTKIRTKFVNKDFLSSRATELGLDRFILYGSNEILCESAKEDMLEALIGAVAVDCDWDWQVLEKVVDKLICLQITKPDLLKTTFYELFNSWHQKRFLQFPNYEVCRNGNAYACILRFSIPENDENLSIRQRVDIERAETRSEARELAAEFAYRFIVEHGLLISQLKDSGIVPKLEDAINQLQELYQKKYVGIANYELYSSSVPTTISTAIPTTSAVQWHCRCTCDGIIGSGTGETKTKAKKHAALMVLNKLFSKKL